MKPRQVLQLHIIQDLALMTIKWYLTLLTESDLRQLFLEFLPLCRGYSQRILIPPPSEALNFCALAHTPTSSNIFF